VNDKVRVGVIAGYSRTRFDADERSSSGTSDNYHLGAYAGAQHGRLGVRTGAAYTWHNVETSRSISAPGIADSASADYDAGTFQAFGEIGYRIDTPAAAVEPFVNLAYVNVKTDAFREQGGAAALDSARDKSDTVFSTLGVRASSEFSIGAAQATARATLGWRHAYGDVVPTNTHSFAGGDGFTVTGVPIARNSAVLEAGVDMQVGDAATLGVGYQGQVAKGAQQHGVTATLRVRF